MKRNIDCDIYTREMKCMCYAEGVSIVIWMLHTAGETERGLVCEAVAMESSLPTIVWVSLLEVAERRFVCERVATQSSLPVVMKVTLAAVV